MTRSRGGWRAGLALAGAAFALGWATLPAQAALVDDRQPGSATVPDSGEAWYAAAPVDLCTTPIGCPPAGVPQSPYPADTLHVGVAGGRETARTYVVPDLSRIPYAATVTGVTMTLPVATAPGDGSLTPESAHVVACLPAAPASDGAEGSTAAPPKVDCSLSAPLRYDAGAAVFTADLTALVAASGGPLPFGVALLPDPRATAVSDAWHVTFNGRDRAGSGHIASRVTFLVAPATGDSPDTDGTTGSTVTDATVPPPTQPGPVELPDAGAAPLDQAPPQVAPPAAPVAQPVAFSHEFQYPMVFLLPLALLAGAVFFVRLFSRDATPLVHRAPVGR
ncbi:MAG TPA: hypothetical protein VFJ98_09075 [Mycobacteriales bacterium]|nr:hypothetical protein [Mycobacteriales bacterium]